LPDRNMKKDHWDRLGRPAPQRRDRSPPVANDGVLGIARAARAQRSQAGEKLRQAYRRFTGGQTPAGWWVQAQAASPGDRLRVVQAAAEIRRSRAGSAPASRAGEHVGPRVRRLDAPDQSARLPGEHTHAETRLSACLKPPPEVFRKAKAGTPTDSSKMVQIARRRKNQSRSRRRRFTIKLAPATSDPCGLPSIETHQPTLGSPPSWLAAGICAAFPTPAKNEAAAPTRASRVLHPHTSPHEP